MIIKKYAVNGHEYVWDNELPIMEVPYKITYRDLSVSFPSFGYIYMTFSIQQMEDIPKELDDLFCQMCKEEFIRDYCGEEDEEEGIYDEWEFVSADRIIELTEWNAHLKGLSKEKAEKHIIEAQGYTEENVYLPDLSYGAEVYDAEELEKAVQKLHYYTKWVNGVGVDTIKILFDEADTVEEVFR